MTQAIAIGADDAAIELKEIIIKHLKSQGFDITDFTDNNDYPDIAFKLASAIQNEEFERGILLCGTGIGMSIAANKVKGVRCAQCHDTFSAQRAKKSNNAQIISLGARVIGSELAKNVIDTWLLSEFEGGNSLRKVEKIAKYEND